MHHKGCGPHQYIAIFLSNSLVASAVTLVPQGTVECGALTVNIRIRKSKRSVLENSLTF